MDSKWQDDLLVAVDQGDLENLRKMLFTDPDFYNNPERKYNVEFNLLYPSDRNVNQKVSECLVNFLEMGATDDLQSCLKIAIIRKNTHLAEFLLKSGAKLDGPAWYDFSPALYSFPLAESKADNRKEMLQLLLKYGLDVSDFDEMGFNLLHNLIDFSEHYNDDRTAEVAQILIDSGTSISEVDVTERTPLFASIERGSIKLITFFIDKGADIKQEVNSSTVLHAACESYAFQNKAEVISLLIRKGADISTLNADGQTPFSLLDPQRENYDLCVLAMVKEFAKLTFENVSVLKKDMDLIRSKPKARKYFKKCLRELRQLAITNFHGPYTYYSLLKMSKNLKKLANLTKNEEILSRFETDLQKFRYYKDDLRIVLNEAIQFRNELDEVLSRVNIIFRDLMPDTVKRKLIDNLKVTDLPME